MKRVAKAVLGAACILAGAISARIYANDTQRLILDAGINLGLWATQVELYDTPAADPGMVAYATNAFNAVTQIRALIRPPFSDMDLQTVLDKISRFPDDTVGQSADRRADQVRQIYNLFLARLSVLFLSTRGIYSSPNCDSAFLRVGYCLGRAQMGAFAGNQAVLSGARSDLLLAIRTGLQTSQGIGCGFNIESVWASLQIDRAMSLADFQALVNPIRQTAFEAVQFFSAINPISPSWPGESFSPPPPSPPAANTLEGHWRSNATNDVVRFDRQGAVFRGYFAAIGRSRLSRIGDLMGEFTPTGDNVYSGKIAIKQPDGSVSWLDGVSFRIDGNTATAMAPWWNAPVTYTRANQ